MDIAVATPVSAEPGSSSTPTLSNSMDQDEERPAKRRRKRKKASCIPCQRRKTKCDKQDPCEACTKRDSGHECTWDAPAIPGAAPDVAEEFGALRRRMKMLEHQLAAKNNTAAAPPFHQEQYQEPQEPYPLLSQNGFEFISDHGSASPSDAHSPELQNLYPLPLNTLTSSPATVIDNSETENAAQALEELALGRKQYSAGGLNNIDLSSVAETSPGAAPHPGANTTILFNLRPGNKSFLSGKSSQAHSLLGSLPDEQVSNALVSNFFVEIGWVYNVVHRPTFLTECAELWTSLRNGNGHRIDPAWLAIYFCILAWSSSTLDPSSPLLALADFTEADLQALPQLWENAANAALEASGWGTKPQLRAVQAICLKLRYQRPSSDPAPDSSDGVSFFVWLGTAIRLCQLMGLHKLGSDPNTMPRDDPGLPLQSGSLKRELAKRVWSFVVTYDWMYCAASGIGQVPPQSFDTDEPLNVDDEDLGAHIIVHPRPAHYLTDISFATAMHTLARYQLVASQQPAAEYEAVMNLDRSLSLEISRLELTIEGSNPRRKPYHRTLLLSMFHNRLLRLHRPFYLLASHDPRCARSVGVCLRSAGEICVGLRKMGTGGPRQHLWWMWSYGIGAVIVLFTALLREEQAGTSIDNLLAKRDLILGVRAFFDPGVTNPSSSAVRNISEQATLLIDHILAPRLLDNNGLTIPPQTRIATVLRDIALRVKSPGNFDASIFGPPVAHEHSEVGDHGINNLFDGYDFGSFDTSVSRTALRELASPADLGFGSAGEMALSLEWEQLFSNFPSVV